MKSHTIFWSILGMGFLVLAAGSPALAAVITSVGSTFGAEVTDWRSTGTPKTLDVDGSNAYGSSLGAVHWQVIGVNQQSAGSSTFGWAYLGDSGQAINGGYTSVDSAAQPISPAVANANAGIVFGAAFNFELTGLTADYTGNRVRVGVMADVLTAAEWAADTNKGFRLVQTVGGLGDSGTIGIRSGGAGDGVPEMYFFDITGVSPGDSFQLQGLNNVGGPTTSGQVGYFGPISWDIAAVPEPSSLTLISFGLIGLARGTRRRK